MILPIVAYGHPILRKICTPITVDYPDLQVLITNMHATMLNANGCGLAAPQVSKPIRLFIVLERVFINAAITHYSIATQTDDEGCLSIPRISAPVPRAQEITITWQDENFHSHTENFDGEMARMIQHEYDHIEGKLYLDHISALQRKLLHSKLSKIAKGKFHAPYPMR
ncbi:peptide deformylase [Chitinophaga sp.]|uniref:peptide deformylase n=1 Tax=Chitinophaga sp. TaxID=1869181 RepID=UPI0031D67E34